MHTFRGGIHPMRNEHEGKRPTSEKAIREYISDTVCIPMGMHLGPPSSPCVQKGDVVTLGQVIGEPVGFLGLPVHASVSGEITDISMRPYLTGEPMMCVSIKNDLKDEWAKGITGLGNVETCDPTAIIPAVKNAGICGMGGASFPTHVKLMIPEGKTCDTIIINGAECETFLTADDRLMRENSAKIVDGLRAAMRALSVNRGVIAIEDNKPAAIEAMKIAANGRDGVEVLPLKTKYPQGGEKQLIKSVTGREVPSGKLPIEINTIVLNAGTAAAIADAVISGKPLVSRVLTCTGHVNNPSNLRVRIGTLVADIVAACGGYTVEPGKIGLGGGMTGVCAPNDNIPVAKATSGIVVYDEKEAKLLEEGPCIRCARCVTACPMGLNPYLLKHYCDDGRLDLAKENNVMDCTACGCCSYVCPAQRWLTASFKNTKDKITLAAKGGK